MREYEPRKALWITWEGPLKRNAQGRRVYHPWSFLIGLYHDDYNRLNVQLLIFGTGFYGGWRRGG